ncbi:MAG: transcriptional regulator MalT [Methanomassiliicoccales archaeon PtaU1.Bin124]|nr:MAG: transcriptional regulator MalT [Methanomassiliicoccales archaeon PtaU1.Bin124]
MNRVSRKSLLTARERLLLHLLPLHRYSQDADAPRNVTQDGISGAIDVGRNNVAKILAELENEKVVEVSTRHVKGLPSVRRVYFLTPKGFEVAKDFKEHVDTLKVEVLDLNGVSHEDEIGRLSMYVPGSYTPLELIMGIERGRFDCSSFHESKVKQEKRFVDFTDKKPAVRSFYGRENEMRVLQELVSEDGPKAVVVYGIPGIGKTTLLAKFAQDVREQSNVFWLKIHEWVDVRGLLRPLAEFLSQDGKKGLEWLLSQAETPKIGEILQLLVNDLQGTPVLIIFDDVQKAEAGVRDIISALINIVDELPDVRLIFATRDMPSFYSRGLVVKNVVKEVQLEGLDDASSQRMLRGRSVSEEKLDQMVRITKGHPLFLELIEDPEAALGKNVRMFIEQEVVSKLDLAEKRVMNVAAVFRYPVIIDAFFVTEEEIHKEIHGENAELDDPNYAISYETVDSLLAKSILHESMGRMIGMHDMLREFTYTRLTPRQRSVYHLAASKFYIQDTSAASQVEGLYHCIMAKDMAKAIDIAAGRGEDIIGKGYLNQFNPLLERLLSEGETKERKELLLLHAQIMDLKGEYDRAIAESEEVLSRIDREKEPRLAASTLLRMGIIEVKRTRFDDAVVRLNEALRLSAMADDNATLAESHYYLGGVEERRGRYEEAEAHYRSTAEFAQKVGDRLAQGKALYGSGKLRAAQRMPDESIKLKKEALAVLERTGDLNIIAKVTMAIGSDLREMDSFEESLRMQQRAVELASNCGDVSTLGYALSNLAATNLMIGNLESADEQIRQATRIMQKLNDPLMLAALHIYRGFLFNMRGDWEWAKEEFQRGTDQLRALNLSSVLAPFLLEIGKTYAARGESAEAVHIFEQTARAAEESKNQRILVEIKKEMKKIGE